MMALVVLAIANPTHAALLLYEGFSYPENAQLNGQVNPSTGGAWVKPAMPAGSTATALIKNDNLTYSNLESSTGLAFSLPRATQSNISKIQIPGNPYNHSTASTSVFFSFLMKMTEFNTSVSDATAATQTHREGDFIAGFTAASQK
jgi:hypothetical protein